jgi:hypothetical protein
VTGFGPTGLAADPAAPPEPVLRLELGPAQERARAAFAAFAAREVAPHAGAWDRAAATPRQVIGRMAAEG